MTGQATLMSGTADSRSALKKATPGATMHRRQERIMLISPTLEGGGSDRVLLNLAELLCDRGFQVHVIVLKDRIDFRVDERIRLVVVGIPEAVAKHKVLQNLWFTLFLKRYLNNQGPFALILSNYQSRTDFFPAAMAPRVYFWVHADYWTDIERLQSASPRRARREVRRIKAFYDHRQLIVVSRAAARSLVEKNRVRPKSCRVIYNPFDFARIRKMAAEENPHIPREEYIVHVAKFDRYKRHDLLFAAFRQMPPSQKLVLLTNSSPGLEELIDRFGLRERILVTGFQQNPYPWIRKAGLLVLSSDCREALPTVLIEALICGTPVVSTDCPNGPREILSGSLARWLVPVDDPQALAERMRQALDHAWEIEEAMIERFSSEVVLGQFLELLPAEPAEHG